MSRTIDEGPLSPRHATHWQRIRNAILRPGGSAALAVVTGFSVFLAAPTWWQDPTDYQRVANYVCDADRGLPYGLKVNCESATAITAVTFKTGAAAVSGQAGEQGSAISGWDEAADGYAGFFRGRLFATNQRGWEPAIWGSAQNIDNGIGVKGEAPAGGTGIWGYNPDGQAAWFDGAVHVNGTLSKAAGTFMIDHPLDPENKVLRHSFVESPDMKNIYDGVATLDAEGEAWVTLPAYFEALNRDFRYQLTNIGGFAPTYVAAEVRENRFKIAGGKRGMRVSWQITGTRKDAFAEDHRVVVEESKAPADRGRYLYSRNHAAPTMGPRDESPQLSIPPPTVARSR
jgi:hypothetical protein